MRPSALQSFSLLVSYPKNALTGEWRKVTPIVIRASSEEEASRTAAAVADFIVAEVSTDVLIRVLGGSSGVPIAEIPRPVPTQPSSHI